MRLLLSRRFWILALLVVVLALGLGSVAALVRNETGYFSPVISPDGQSVYFVRRSTLGIVWGLGFENFTPPANSHLWRDRFELCRIKMDGGGFEILHSWPRSPLEGRTIQEYRGRVFTYPSVVLRFEEGTLRYQVAVSVPRMPSSETHLLRGEWDASGRASADGEAWTAGYDSMSPGEDMLREPWEVMTIPGRESYPCGLAAYNDRGAELRVLRKTSICDILYPGGVRWENLASLSRRQDIRRLRELRDLREKLIGENRARGLNEGSAILGADHALEELGYYPKPPQLVARALPAQPSEGARPLFRISEMEFKVGLFEDIRKATDAPGTEVERSMGRYLIHRDYDTSRRLNEFLGSGGKTFYVERVGRIYEVTVTPERPRSR